MTITCLHILCYFDLTPPNAQTPSGNMPQGKCHSGSRLPALPVLYTFPLHFQFSLGKSTIARYISPKIWWEMPPSILTPGRNSRSPVQRAIHPTCILHSLLYDNCFLSQPCKDAATYTNDEHNNYGIIELLSKPRSSYTHSSL